MEVTDEAWATTSNSGRFHDSTFVDDPFLSTMSSNISDLNNNYEHPASCSADRVFHNLDNFYLSSSGDQDFDNQLPYLNNVFLHETDAVSPPHQVKPMLNSCVGCYPPPKLTLHTDLEASKVADDIFPHPRDHAMLCRPRFNPCVTVTPPADSRPKGPEIFSCADEPCGIDYTALAQTCSTPAESRPQGPEIFSCAENMLPRGIDYAALAHACNTPPETRPKYLEVYGCAESMLSCSTDYAALAQLSLGTTPPGTQLKGLEDPGCAENMLPCDSDVSQLWARCRTQGPTLGSYVAGTPRLDEQTQVIGLGTSFNSMERVFPQDTDDAGLPRSPINPLVHVYPQSQHTTNSESHYSPIVGPFQPQTLPVSSTDSVDPHQDHSSTFQPPPSFNPLEEITPIPSGPVPADPPGNATPPSVTPPTFVNWHTCQCSTTGPGSPCGSSVGGTVAHVRHHLKWFHNFKATGKTLHKCLWEGCMDTLQKENIPRHIVSRHLREKVTCDGCGMKLSRRDVRYSHARSCIAGRS